MGRFCYKCGTPETEGGPLIGGMCQRCFASENPLLRAPEEITVEVCGRCGAYRVECRWWYPENPTTALLEAAKRITISKLRVAQYALTRVRYVKVEEAELVDVKIEPKFTPAGPIVEVLARGKIHESQTRSQIARAEIKVCEKRVLCDTCSRISSGYYGAILQVRGEERLPSDGISKIRDRLMSYFFEKCKRDHREFVSKVEFVRGGLDFYLSSVKLARQGAVVLKSELGAKIKETAKLVGWDRRGRRRFRVSVLARIPKNRLCGRKSLTQQK